MANVQTCVYDGCISQRHTRDGLCRRHQKAVDTGQPPTTPKRALTLERKREVKARARELRALGWSLSKIAGDLSVSIRTVARYLNERNDDQWRKATPEVLEEFEFLTSFGTPDDRVADRLGVSLETIRRAQNRTERSNA